MLASLRKYYTQDEKSISLFFLGTIFLFLSLYLTIGSGSFELWGASFLSLLILWKYPSKGALFSIILVAVAALWSHLFVTDTHLWQLGLEFSVLSSLLVMALTSKDLEESILKIKEKLVVDLEKQGEADQKFSNYSAELEKEKEAIFESKSEVERALSSSKEENGKLQHLIDTMNETGKELARGREALLSDLNDKAQNVCVLKRELEELQKNSHLPTDSERINRENQNLLIEVNAAKSELHKNKKEREEITNLLAQEKIKRNASDTKCESLVKEYNQLKQEKNLKTVSPSEIAQLKKLNADLQKSLSEKVDRLGTLHQKVEDLKQIEPVYFQLRKQFEEKNQVLHEARSQLFRTESEIMSLERKNQSLEQRFDPAIEKLLGEMSEIDQELELFKSENEELIGLITKLSQPEEKGPDLFY